MERRETPNYLTDPDEIKECFQLLDDWEERYKYMIDLGKKLPKLSVDEKCEQNRFHGCQNQVWYLSGYSIENPPLFSMKAESESSIVQGLISIVMSLFVGQEKTYVESYDINGFFKELELSQHLSPTRANGLNNLVSEIRKKSQAA